MYHISKDSRAQKSAELICKGLSECLKEKPLSKITITDINKKSFVSRATFYRMFDNIHDVFAYECDRVFLQIQKVIKENKNTDKKERIQMIAEKWFLHNTLFQTLVANNLDWIVLESHARNAEILKKLYSVPFNDDKKDDYFIAMLSSIIFSAISVFFRHGQTEKPEDIQETLCKCIEMINERFNKGNL